MVHELLRKLDHYYESSEYAQLEDTVVSFFLLCNPRHKFNKNWVIWRIEWNERRVIEGILVSKTDEERHNLFTQQSAKQLLLQEIQNGPNSSSKIEERLKHYKELTVECYLKGMIEGETLASKCVYYFVSIWFHSFNEYVL